MFIDVERLEEWFLLRDEGWGRGKEGGGGATAAQGERGSKLCAYLPGVFRDVEMLKEWLLLRDEE